MGLKHNLFKRKRALMINDITMKIHITILQIFTTDCCWVFGRGQRQSVSKTGFFVPQPSHQTADKIN